MREPFERLKENFLTLGRTIGTGLGWAWENVLKPFLTWIVQSVSPIALDIISGALGVLNDILIAISPLFVALWENVLLPLGQWAGETFIQALTWVSEKLAEVSLWISENQGLVQNIALLIGSIALVVGTLAVALGIYNAVAAVAAAVTAFFATGMAGTVLILGGIMLAIIALGVVIYLLITNWDKVKEVATAVWEKIVEVWSVVAAWFDEHVVAPLKETWGEIEKRLEEFKIFFTEKVVEPLKEKFGNLVEKWQEFAGVVKEKVIDPLVNWFQDWLLPKNSNGFGLDRDGF